MPARLAANATLVIGLVSVAGWTFDVQALTSVIPGSVEMKFNTALAIVCCSGSLILLTGRESPRIELLARVAGLAVTLLAVATLSEYIFGIDLRIDELVVRDKAGAYNVFRGRMSPFSAVALGALGTALAATPGKNLRGVVLLASTIAVLIGVGSLLGYAWNAGEIITDKVLPPVALNTALCFTTLGLGTLFSAHRSSLSLGDQLGDLAAVEFKIAAGFLVALSLLLVGGTYTYRTSVQFASSVEWVAHSQQVRASLASLYGSVAGAEVALRDYLLTTDPQHRGEYERLAGDMPMRTDEIARLTADNRVQQENTAILRPLIAARLAAMSSTLLAFADFGLPAARAVLNVNRATNATRDVHALVARMDVEEARLLQAHERNIRSARQTTLISLFVTLSLASGLFIILFRGIHREMLARREAENALRASDQYNRSIVDSSPDCLGVLSLDARLTQLTPQGCRLLDVDDFRTIDGIDWVKVWKSDDRIAARNAVAAARNGSHGRFQGFCPTLKGKPKWWDVIVMPILGADGNVERLLSVSRDISDVKHAENELKQANHFLDSLFESLPVMVYVKDARTLQYVRINRAYEQAMGITRERMLGRTARDLLPAGEADIIAANDRKVLEGGQMLDIPEEIVHNAHGLSTRHTMQLPIVGEDGKTRHLMGISVDITERKLAEQAIRELNTALLAKAEQLETTNHELESFSYSVSHDLRAPLRAIDGFALMMEEDFHDRLDPEGRRYLAVIRDNSKRMGALIDDLLQFSRLGRLPVVNDDVNVDNLVREVVKEVLNEYMTSSKGAERPMPQLDIGPLPAARGDRALLRQVWTNLISNAVKYSGKAPQALIRVRGHANGTDNHYSVGDNGVGFDMAYVEKLFGVFQRLHRADEFDGTGVGLAIVHRVVTRHGGRVWAEGRPEHGAVFSFALPKGDSHG